MTLINGSHDQDILHFQRHGQQSKGYLKSNNILFVGSGDQIHIVSDRITVTATQDLQFFAENIRLAATKDVQITAGGQMGIASDGDLAVVSEKGEVGFGAINSVLVESQTATTRVAGPAVEVLGSKRVHLEGGVDNVNTAGERANIPPTKVPVMPKSPDRPPDPKFHTPFS